MHENRLILAAQDLIRKMLEVDPCKRLTTREVLNHEWLLNDCIAAEACSEWEREMSVGSAASHLALNLKIRRGDNQRNDEKNRLLNEGKHFN